MRRTSSVTVAALLAAAAALACIGLAHGHGGERHHRETTGDAPSEASRPAVAAKQRWGADYFPNVPLLTQEGRTVRFYDDLLKGKGVVINLVYTQCIDLCPLETARLAQVQKLLGERVGKDIFFYSISIDPKHDTPEVLKAYMAKFGVGPGWTFLTGKQADIALISRKLGLSSLTDIADRDGHLPSLMVGNVPDGQWMRQSALDNPRFLATKISTFLLGWKNQREVQGESYAAARPIESLDPGEYLFRTRCSACHTLGKGAAVGPDLAGVAQVRDRAWLARYIKAPDKVLSEKDPIATQLFAKYQQVRMPNLRLGDADVEHLIKYLEARRAPSPGTQTFAGPAMTGPKSNAPRFGELREK